MSDRLLPTGSTALEIAAAEALASPGAMSVPLRQLWNPYTCPVELLPYLAWAWSVDRWDQPGRKRQSGGGERLALYSPAQRHYQGNPARG